MRGPRGTLPFFLTVPREKSHDPRAPMSTPCSKPSLVTPGGCPSQITHRVGEDAPALLLLAECVALHSFIYFLKTCIGLSVTCWTLGSLGSLGSGGRWESSYETCRGLGGDAGPCGRGRWTPTELGAQTCFSEQESSS